MPNSGLRRGEVRWGSLAAALVLHLVLAVVVAGLPIGRLLRRPQEEVIPIELVTHEGLETSARTSKTGKQNATAGGPRPSPPAAKAARPVMNAPVDAEPKGRGAMVRATQLFSSHILADPRSRRALEGLRQLATAERIVQLCNVEAMEQVHRWKAEFLPDFLVAYAMANTVLSGAVLRADGGALRSKGNWYNIRYRCEVSADLAAVAAFEFSLGAEIPRPEWEAHSLTPDDVPGD